MPFLRLVEVHPAAPAPVRRLRAHNISRGGLFLHSTRPPEVGSHVELRLSVRGRAVPLGRGVVAWKRPPVYPATLGQPPGFAVRFQKLTSRSRALLDLIIEHSTEAGDDLADLPPSLGTSQAIGLPLARRSWRRLLVAALVFTTLGAVAGYALARAKAGSQVLGRHASPR